MAVVCTTRTDVVTEFTRRAWLSIGAAAASDLLPLPVGAAPGADRIRLSLNENPLGPSPLAVEAIKAQLTDPSRYSGAEVAELTKTIADREGIPAEQIVLGENLDVLGLYLSAHGGSGGEFIYSEPGYTALVSAVAPAGGVVVGVPLNQDLENDLHAIAAKVSARTRAIYLVNPHNPSGTASDAAQFIDVVRDLSKRALVIVDEAYLEFMPDFETRTTARLVRAGEQVAVFRTFSKIHGLASLAIGYTLAPAGLAASVKQLGRLRSSTIAGTRSVSETLRQTALTFNLTSSEWIRKIVLPAAAPSIFVGLRLGLTVALVVTVVTEMIAGNNGIGYAVLQSQQMMLMPELYAGVLLLAATGYGVNFLFTQAEQRLLFWSEHVRSGRGA